MAGWRKHFRGADIQKLEAKTVGSSGPSATHNRFHSWLPEVYTGQPNRVERYTQYDQMDQDSEINAALDTIAEFSTQLHPVSQIPFEIKYKTEPTDSEVSALETTLKQWVRY